ncbi:MucBP domain-containing protein [Levilactobacillus brevis]|nr:MucBP domain-containing protein [Levilactobacillus brevis]
MMRKQRIFKWFLMVAMLITGMLLGGPAIRAAADDTTATDEETLDVYTPAWHGKVPDTRPSISSQSPFSAPEGCIASINLDNNITVSDSTTFGDILSDLNSDSALVKRSMMEYSSIANGLFLISDINSDAAATISNVFDHTSMNTADLENMPTEKPVEYTKSPGHYYIVLPGQPNKYTAKIIINQLNASGETSDIATTTATSAYTTGLFTISAKYLVDDAFVINAGTGQEMTLTRIMDMDGSDYETFPVDVNQGPQTFTIVPQDQLLHATVNYKFADGTEAAPSAKLSGYAGLTTVSAKSPTISGYTPDQKEVAVAFAPTEKTYTVTYKANPTTPTATESSASSSTADEATTFTPFKIYGKRALYTYKNATFKKNQRVSHYAQKSKAYAPIFEVVGTAKSTSGHLRYKLADGTYVTANADYVGALYWQGMYQKLYVTNPKGTNAYDGTRFAQATKQKHYRQGTALTVVKQTQVGQTTRYELTNGTYVTGNKQWVSPTKPRLAKQVKVKRTIRLYRDVNGSTFIKRIKPGKTLTVTGWDYSHGRNPRLSGTLRYRVAGGYITANRQFVVAN